MAARAAGRSRSKRRSYEMESEWKLHRPRHSIEKDWVGTVAGASPMSPSSDLDAPPSSSAATHNRGRHIRTDVAKPSRRQSPPRRPVWTWPFGLYELTERRLPPPSTQVRLSSSLRARHLPSVPAQAAAPPASPSSPARASYPPPQRPSPTFLQAERAGEATNNCTRQEGSGW
ncbi:hypothetical protein B0H16DRAFT_1739930 [Mycena metata]|uniref:Uncharacterized protein n=1 Tax=Mycena metata TaxID=1033252 RepID=A0AAD7HE34_9AGAR|nr:hypothetical protein B0H16DRAFT_1739930 [Mycena metata]